MAMEQNLLNSVQQNFTKEEDASLTKWNSSTESVNESSRCPSGGFDCNICLETVQDPVVTFCGHLYCWPCISKWINHEKTAHKSKDTKTAQCPVCKTEISEKTIVTLYACGKTTEKNGLNLEVGPPRPRTLPAQQVSQRAHSNVASSAAVPIAMHMISPTSPTTGMLAEMVYKTIFGNGNSSLFAYPNSYNVTTQAVRRQAMQAERSLTRVSFFLLCCVMLCLLLF